LEKISNKKFRTLQNAYYAAVKDDVIRIDKNGHVHIAEEMLALLKPYQPEKLRGSFLLIIFDIPETDRWKRQQLRSLLRQLQFKQIQKSVWQSSSDSRVYLKQEIKRLGLETEIILYEARKLI
jgi:DNA-binding transcriptional regulator PaaX